MAIRLEGLSQTMYMLVLKKTPNKLGTEVMDGNGY